MRLPLILRHSAKAITECIRQELIYMEEKVRITVSVMDDHDLL